MGQRITINAMIEFDLADEEVDSVEFMENWADQNLGEGVAYQLEDGTDYLINDSRTNVNKVSTF